MDVRKVNTPTRASSVSSTVKGVLKDMGGNLAKFMDNTNPMLCKWYHINKRHSVYGKGLHDSAGPYEGGIKYNLIHNYVAYGYVDERGVDVEEGDNLRIRMKPQDIVMIHIPGSLIPSANDRLSLELEDHKYLYMVKDSRPVTWNNKPYYRTEITKCDIHPVDYYEEDFKADGLIVKELDYVEDNVGTKDSPFLEAGASDALNELNKMKDDLLNKYNDYYYKSNQNMYMATEPRQGMFAYTPLMVDLQMEYRPFWVYGVNAILTHETIVNKMSKYNYHDHIIRDFLNKEEGAWDKLQEDGIDFSTYIYTSDISSPMYKIQSYLNDGEYYYIYDYYYGMDTYYDDCGKPIINVDNRYNLKVPDNLKELLDKYYHDELDVDYLKSFIKSYFKFGLSFENMFWTMIVLIIIDTVVKNINSGSLNKPVTNTGTKGGIK